MVVISSTNGVTSCRWKFSSLKMGEIVVSGCNCNNPFLKPSFENVAVFIGRSWDRTRTLPSLHIWVFITLRVNRIYSPHMYEFASSYICELCLCLISCVSCVYFFHHVWVVSWVTLRPIFSQSNLWVPIAPVEVVQLFKSTFYFAPKFIHNWTMSKKIRKKKELLWMAIKS